jgi:hypothetical protein
VGIECQQLRAPVDWRAEPRGSVPPEPVELIGQYRSAVRCIDPPSFDLTPLDDAATYEILIAPRLEPETVWSLRAPEPRIDMAPVWSKLPFGDAQFQPRAWDGDGQLIGFGAIRTLARSPDWEDHQPQPLDYRAAGRGVIDYLVNHVADAPDHPGDPAYVWHAAVDAAGSGYLPYQFPALVYTHLINLFLTGAALGMDTEVGVDLRERARRLGDFLIEHPAVTSGPLAGIPYSTMTPEGVGGRFEPDRGVLIRLGWIGGAILRLGEATGDSRYTNYAKRLGHILLDFQREDGSWPFRVRYADGEILEPYTAGSIIAMLLLEQLAEREPDGPYNEAVERGIAWVLENPVKTGLWQPMYEDVEAHEPYMRLEQIAAAETAVFLIRRKHPRAVEVARQLVRYVEDQFVIFGDEAITPVSYLPFTPCAIEQYGYYWPMETHTAKYMRAALALYEATGEPVWGHKAVAAANTIVHCQRPDGRLSTAVPDRRLGMAPHHSVKDWFNCMAYAANILLQIGPSLARIGVETTAATGLASLA